MAGAAEEDEGRKETSPRRLPPALPRPRVAAARNCAAPGTKPGAEAGSAGLRVRVTGP